MVPPVICFISSILPNFHPFRGNLSSGNKEKSIGAKSGEYGDLEQVAEVERSSFGKHHLSLTNTMLENDGRMFAIFLL